MKKFLKPAFLPYLTLIASVLGGLSMFWLHATGTDDRLLLDPTHPGAIAAWVLTVLMIAGAILLSLPLTGKMRYNRLFPASVPAGIGTFICAAAIGITGFGELTAATDPISTGGGALGLISALCLGYMAWCRLTGRRPHILAASAVVVYLMFHMLCRYRLWSAEPELLRYFFCLAGTVCATLAFYYRTAFITGIVERGKYMIFTSLTAFFTLTALAGSEDRIFLGGMAVWALTDLCSLRLRKPRQPQGEQK
jgi:hypothetical protein